MIKEHMNSKAGLRKSVNINKIKKDDNFSTSLY